MKFALRFIGINVQKRVPSLRYYADRLHLPIENNPDRNIIVPETTGMRVEIFVPRGRSKVFDHAVTLQTVRPCIHVHDLKATVAHLGEMRATLGEGPEKTALGRRMEFVAPHGIRWLVAEGRGHAKRDGFKKPHVGSADLSARDLDAQVRFYADLLGLQIVGEHKGQVVLRDRRLGTSLLVVNDWPKREALRPSLPAQPAFLSFRTSSVKAAEEMLRSRGVVVVRPTLSHYFGTDLLVLDAEKNIVQISGPK